jgi:hypothetical protein
MTKLQSLTPRRLSLNYKNAEKIKDLLTEYQLIYPKLERFKYIFIDEGLALQSTARPWTLVEPASQD